MSRIYGGPNGYGYTRHSNKFPCASFNDLKLAASPSGAADLRYLVNGEVLNQTQTSSCTGHGVAMGATVAMRSHGTVLDMISPRGCYGVGRAMDRLVNSHGVLPPLHDEGCETAQVVSGIQLYGTRPMRDRVVVDGVQVNSDCNSDNVNEEPNLSELITSYSTRLLGAHLVASFGVRRIVDVSLALDAGYPVVFGTFVDTAFESYSGGVFGAARLSDPDGGGHCMCCLGYTGLGDNFVGIGRNSWGKDWGNFGDFRFGPAFIAQWEDIFVLSITKAA